MTGPMKDMVEALKELDRIERLVARRKRLQEKYEEFDNDAPGG